MADYTWPAGPKYCPARFAIHRVSFGFSSRSQVTADGQDRPSLGWFWRGSMTLVPATHAERAAVEATVHGWGMGDRMTFGHMGRRKLGTVTGTVTVVGSHAAGVRQINVTGTNGQTIRAGDMFNAGGCFYQARLDATLSGTTAVHLVGTLLTNLSNGNAVNFDTPTSKWIRLSPIPVEYLPGYSAPIEIDFEERRD